MYYSDENKPTTKPISNTHTHKIKEFTIYRIIIKKKNTRTENGSDRTTTGGAAHAPETLLTSLIVKGLGRARIRLRA